jgi:hypothetical protein
MNPTTAALAQAHIDDLRRQACRARFADAARVARRRRRSSTGDHRRFRVHFVPVTSGLFRH